MRFNEIIFEDLPPIDSYGPGFFRVAGQTYEGGMITGPKGTSLWDGYDTLAPLLDIADDIDVLFVGSGGDIAQIPGEMRQTLEAAGIGVEVMASPAAARTYNVLLSEGRRVAAALLAV